MNDMSNNTSKEWDKENMRTVSCRLRKDEAEAFKRLCASKGTTVHAALARYIRLAIHDLPIDRPEEEGSSTGRRSPKATTRSSICGFAVRTESSDMCSIRAACGKAR